MAEPIRVLLADDHPLVRSGLRSGLEDAPDLTLVGEAKDGGEARQLCQDLEPDVLLLDLNMPGPPAVETIHYLRDRCPEVKVLVLTAYDDDTHVRSMTRAGVAGYVLKDEPMEALIEAVRTVNAGGAWFSQEVVDKAVRQHTEIDGLELTGREREVLSAIARGWSNAQIADHFALTEQTVRNYVSQIYTKLDVSSRAEAVIWALEHGFEGRHI